MQKSPHFLLLLAYFMSLLFIQVRSQDEMLRVINTGRFGLRQNTIELECRNDRGETIQGARFWLNKVERDQELTVLSEFTESLRLMDSGRVIFEITRELEGTYFCGRDLEDYSPDGQQLIAHPDPTITPSSELRFFAKVGTTAHLNCSLLPGALKEQYFADWRNASSSTNVARLIGPRTLPATSPAIATPDPRFRIDETTFALSIDSVSLTDAGDYQCVLGVRDPGGRTLSYPQTETVSLTLVVYQAPLIDRAPRDRIIALSQSTQSIAFRCSARGDPQPRIEWIHRDNDNVMEESEKYSIQTTAFRTGTGDFITSSRLIIHGLDAFDAGQVMCRAVNEDETIPAELQSASRSAQLAVIGSINSFSLLISTNQDVIFKLGLPLPILVPVQLNIIYIDINNPDNTLQMVTKNSYNNTGFITHFEPSSQVPTYFSTFRVKIALQYQNLQGPFNESALIYDLQTPTVFTKEEASVKQVTIISAASAGTVALVVIALLVSVLACKHNKLQQEKNKHQEQENEYQLQRERENHKHQERENEYQLQRERENNEHQLKLAQMKYKFLGISDDSLSKSFEISSNHWEVLWKIEFRTSIKKEEFSTATIKESSKIDNNEMTDGHDESALTRGGSINHDCCNYQAFRDKCLEDYFVNIVQAGMEHIELVPGLKRMLSSH